VEKGGQGSLNGEQGERDSETKRLADREKVACLFLGRPLGDRNEWEVEKGVDRIPTPNKLSEKNV